MDKKEEFKRTIKEELSDNDNIIHHILNVNYKKLMDGNKKEKTELYPLDWFLIKDVKKKNAILVEAIKMNKLIIDTKIYQPFIEGVRGSGADGNKM